MIFTSFRVVLSLRMLFSCRRKSVQVVLPGRGTVAMEEKEVIVLRFNGGD